MSRLTRYYPVTLFFAALSNVTDPPTVHVPASPSNPEFTLSVSTCPANLLPLFRLWQKAVNPLQSLSLDQQADVARLLCDLEPESQPVTTQMVKLSADLQSIAISISQRQTYLERYTHTLEAGLGGRDGRFHAPPTYGEQQQQPAVPLSRHDSVSSQNTFHSTSSDIFSPSKAAGTSSQNQHHRTPSSASAVADLPVTEDPALISVRETFYSILSDVIEASGLLGKLLRDDPARGYYTAVAMAIVQAAMTSLTPDAQRVRVVSFNSGQPRTFGTDDAPVSFRVFVRALVSLGKILRELEEKDNNDAIELAMRGEDDLRSLTRIELLKQELEVGVEAGDAGDISQAAEIRSIANHVRRMSTAVTSLPGESRTLCAGAGG